MLSMSCHICNTRKVDYVLVFEDMLRNENYITSLFYVSAHKSDYFFRRLSGVQIIVLYKWTVLITR
jgi:hypothetical protein